MCSEDTLEHIQRVGEVQCEHCGIRLLVKVCHGEVECLECGHVETCACEDVQLKNWCSGNYKKHNFQETLSPQYERCSECFLVQQIHGR